MDPNDSIGLARPPAFVLNLRKLPRELVHQVLDELPLIKVLQILSHKNSHLDDCVLTHIHYRLAFTSPEDIVIVRDRFIFYREVCRFTGLPLAQATSILSRGGASLPFNVVNLVRDNMLNAICDNFPSPFTLDMTLLEAHASSPYPEESAGALVRWNWIKEAKRGLNATKARQLTMAADLMAEFPEKLMLKRPLDPSQDRPRKNQKHIENSLRLRAKKALVDRKCIHNARGHCVDAVDNIELIPYDRYLWLFLETLEKNPHQNSRIEPMLREMSLIAKETGRQRRNLFSYPSDIAEGIDKVLKGIMYIYTSSSLLVVPRIDWEGSQTSDPTKKKPTFYIETEPHSPHLPNTLHRCEAAKIMPHDEREYEWLRAFLEVVTWMEDAFGYEKMKEHEADKETHV